MLYGILHRDAMILYAKFGFFLYWSFHTYSSQFVLMCFCVYIHVLPLCCMPHLLIFLRCSLAFVILPVSTLLLFMPYFQKLAFSSLLLLLTDRRPPGLLSAHSLVGVWGNLPTPYHRIFNNLFITIFFYLLFILCFVLF